MIKASPSVRTYTAVFAALLVLVLTTTLIGFLDLGPFTMVIALTIATIKATLVASYFMQALYESKVVRVVFSAGVIWFLIMVTLTLGDYMSRGWVSNLGGK